MCGLTGFWTTQPMLNVDSFLINIRNMTQLLHHRGPDAQGVWTLPEVGLAFGHARLAIIDLSPTGQQPMVSFNGRFTLLFNGEIYNHLSLRMQLEQQSLAPAWRGYSDTETLLAAFEAWGVSATLKLAVGMFAMALWDDKQKTLTLIRDRFGEKPLYYGWAGLGSERALVFGSELKALRGYPNFSKLICRGALAQYLRFMYVPAPRTIHPGVFKLEPGCLLTVRSAPPSKAPAQPLRPGQSYESLSITRWWSLASVVEAGAQDSLHDENEVVDQLETVLKTAVHEQSLADVPLGAFLSGGVDSSTIVALMQAQASQPVKTFTIGFDEAGFDESPHALAVAKHLGTEHHEMRVSARMAQDVIPRLPWMYDEPFADSSQIPTHLVCHAARQHVTVALSGDAGDELFGGYNRYFWGPNIWRRVSWLPLPLRQLLSHVLVSLPPSTWNILALGGIPQLGQKVHKLAIRLRCVRHLDDFYRSLVSEWSNPTDLLKQTHDSVLIEPNSLLDDPLPTIGAEMGELRMMYRDSMTYLPDDILCKVDRAAMATSLETRVPFLDHRVAELAWRIPLQHKIRGNQGKWALRQVLYRHVPRELIERPKAGFALPVGQWLRGPLYDWAEELLAEQRLAVEGYFKPQPIRQLWLEHLRGTHDHTPKLWSVLMFQSWLVGQAA